MWVNKPSRHFWAGGDLGVKYDCVMFLPAARVLWRLPPTHMGSGAGTLRKAGTQLRDAPIESLCAGRVATCHSALPR